MKKNSSKDVLIDIPMCAYNFEKYIAQAMEGVLNQKTDFRFRLIIGEDFSTDNTRLIVQTYLEQYPDKIEVYFHDRNLGAFENSKILFGECSAKYIALCDGDDYWIDLNKLQKQIDFLESHEDYVACFHNVKINDASKSEEKLVYQSNRKKEISLIDLANGDYMHTCSLVFRNLPGFFYPFLNNQVPMDDDSIGYCLLLNGRKAYYMDEVMAVYRKHSGGMWSLLNQEKRLVWTLKHHQASIRFYNDDILNPKLKERLKVSSILLMKMAMRKVDPMLFLRGLKIFIFG